MRDTLDDCFERARDKIQSCTLLNEDNDKGYHIGRAYEFSRRYSKDRNLSDMAVAFLAGYFYGFGYREN